MVALAGYFGLWFCRCDFIIFLRSEKNEVLGLTRGDKRRIYTLSSAEDSACRGVEQPGSSSGS